MQADQQVSLALVLRSLEFSSTLLQLLWIRLNHFSKTADTKRSPSLIPHPIWGCACLVPMHLPESSSSLQLADPSGYKALHFKISWF